MEAVRGLEGDPFPRAAARLSGVTPPMWRIRVGEYRAFYSVSLNQNLIIVERISRRTGQTYERFR